MLIPDKRIHQSERSATGACDACGRRHIHRDNCPVLQRREQSYMNVPTQRVRTRRTADMIKQTNRRRTLVNRLRTPTHPSMSRTDLRDIAEKLDAIGEALAYLVDKRWAKQKREKLKRKGG